MKPLFTNEELRQGTNLTKLPCECYQCGNTFFKEKKNIITYLNGNPKHSIKYCSSECRRLDKTTKQLINCTTCNTDFLKYPNQIKKSKSGNHFCSKSCAATYNNKNKTHGTRRSKLEVWIEEQLTILYPDLKILFNGKTTIKSELDIFIPRYQLAFELNGIFHYEPIYGYKKLSKIMENDLKKSDECRKKYIMLHSINTSNQKYFKPSTSQKYLDLISEIINERILTSK